MVKINSNWAIDFVHNQLFVVGDVGRAVVFDCDFGAKHVKQGKKRTIYMAKQEQVTLPIHKKWFWVHDIPKNSAHYVNTVRFLEDENLFVTATSGG